MSLQKIGLKNFRVFKEQTDFELAPITVFTGPNNSGKSTAIKALILLAESAKSSDFFYLLKTSTESGYTSSSKIKNDSIDEEDVEFNFAMEFREDLEYYTNILSKYTTSYINNIFNVQLNYSKFKNQLFELKNFKVQSKGNTLLEFKNDGEIRSFQIDFIRFFDKVYDQIKTDRFENTHFEAFDKDFKPFSKHYLTNDFIKRNAELIQVLDDDLFRIFQKEYNENSYPLSGQSLLKSLRSLEFKLEDMREGYLKKPFEEDGYLENFIYRTLSKIKSTELYREEVISLKDAYAEIWQQLHTAFFEIIKLYIITIKKELEESTKYFPTFRQEPMREFSRTTKNNLSENLFCIIDNDKKIFGKTHIARKLGSLGQGAFIFTNEVIRNIYGFGDKIIFKANEYNGNFELKILSKDRQEGINIADLGSGVYQLISLLVAIEIAIIDGGYNGYFKPETPANFTLLVEEPEISLHPNFQSKLADVFSLANKKYGVNFIIETHSEYLIRKLQYLTLKKELVPGDSKIYYLNSIEDLSNGNTHMKQISIKENGLLTTSFGKGFLDETPTIMLALLTGENLN